MKIGSDFVHTGHSRFILSYSYGSWLMSVTLGEKYVFSGDLNQVLETSQNLVVIIY